MQQEKSFEIDVILDEYQTTVSLIICAPSFEIDVILDEYQTLMTFEVL